MLKSFGDALDALSRHPSGRWSWSLAHHGVRLLVLVAIALIVHALFPVSPVPDLPLLDRGMVAERDLVAQVPFPIYKSEQDLGRERAEAAASVAPIIDYDAGASDTLATRLRVFFASVDSAAALPAGAQPLALGRVLTVQGLPTSPEVVALLRQPRVRAALKLSLEESAREDLPSGVISAADLQASGGTQLRIRRAERETLVNRVGVRTPTWLYERAALRLPWDAPQGTAELQRVLLIHFLHPSLRLNEDATETARGLARAAVSPVAGRVLQGERIITAHEQVGSEELQRLNSYRNELARLGRMDGGRTGHARAIGAFLFDLIMLLVFGLMIRLYRPSVYGQFRHVLVLAGLVLVVVAAAAIIDRAGAPIELIPVAIAALIVAALWDGRMALHLALVLAVLLAGQAPFLGTGTLFGTVTGGAAAALAIRVVRRRAQIWVVIALIATAYAATALTMGLLRTLPLDAMLWSGIWGAINAAGSTLIAMGLLPLIEAFARITTDQTLLELADMNRPLLRRLAMEAPGTYAHSVSVANLTEAAARVSGGNPLLARVGTYYHDVGKMAKPQYFIENQPQGRNPHDRLKPATSAAIVRGHVGEGMRLAEQYKLPDAIKAFIREHHGTQTIGFFKEQAREENPEGDLNAADFAYPGPRPRSKETAILMLADAVESAARVLQDPTHDRIRALVDRIVGTKMEQGQLDDAPLTLGEISRIKQEFTKVLEGTYHHRIDYPHMQIPVEGPPGAAAAQEVTPEAAGAVPADAAPAAAPSPADARVPGMEGSAEVSPPEAAEPAPAGSGNGGRR